MQHNLPAFLNLTFGELEWLDGSKYKGELREGKMSGKGIFLHPNGYFYDGSWFEDKEHGFGVITANGISYKVLWDNGRLFDCLSQASLY
jgi:hypothetical protein